MKYALLLYGDESVWQNADEEQRRAIYAKHAAFLALLQERNALVGGAELAHSSKATTVRKRDGDDVRVTDGPFPETAEPLTGFYLVDVRDRDEALELARALPSGNVEVRPMVEPETAG
jgi:hypothetical protein